MADSAAPLPRSPIVSALVRGTRASWISIALIALINTGIAGVNWIDDPRPFWHPLLTVQILSLIHI